jgi:tetratricopeptide (TPR) repeat protein
LLSKDPDRLQESEKYVLKALELDPNHAPTLHHYANLLVRMGGGSNLVKSLSYYSAASALIPSDIKIKYNFGTALTMLRTYDLAKQLYYEILEVAPDDESTRHNLYFIEHAIAQEAKQKIADQQQREMDMVAALNAETSPSKFAKEASSRKRSKPARQRKVVMKSRYSSEDEYNDADDDSE